MTSLGASTGGSPTSRRRQGGWTSPGSRRTPRDPGMTMLSPETEGRRTRLAEQGARSQTSLVAGATGMRWVTRVHMADGQIHEAEAPSPEESAASAYDLAERSLTEDVREIRLGGRNPARDRG